MSINAEIQNLKEENEMLRNEINRLRNEINQLKRNELREVVGDAKPEAPIYGYLND
jgi:cell division protein FtsB